MVKDKETKEITSEIAQKKGFFAQVGGVIKDGVRAGVNMGTTGVKIAGGLIKYIGTPTNWGKSGRHIVYDGKQVVNKARGKPVNEKDYVHPIKFEPYSVSFDTRLTAQGEGYVAFQASKTLIGDIAKISDAQIEKVNELNDKNKNFNIAIDRVARKIVIEIDVQKIIDDVKDDPRNKGKSEKEIKKLAIGKIIEEADASLKELANITGGEFKDYADSKLLKGIGENLYQSFDKKQEKDSESPEKKPSKSSEDIFSLTNPHYMPGNNRESITSNYLLPGNNFETIKSIISKDPCINSGLNNIVLQDNSEVLNQSLIPNASDSKSNKGPSK